MESITYKSSYITDNHVSEGVMVTLENGDILHFFRFAEGLQSDHADNRGKIVKRKSIDGGKNWSAIVTVYEDQYDDRNVHGGITDDGRIVLFFRRYDANSVIKTVDMNFIYSDDGGVNWSNRQTIDTEGVSFGTHRMVYVPTKGYMQLVIGHHYIEAWFSNDGSVWNKPDRVIVADYRTNEEYHLNESCATYVGDGKIILLSRDDGRQEGDMYYQITSNDYGATWSLPIRTNIGSPHWTPAPCIFYDEETSDVFVFATDRRSDYEGASQRANEEIWVYKNNPNEIFNNPNGYNLFFTANRPYSIYSERPLNRSFYGYVTYTKRKNGKYLFVVTDRYTDNYNEDADLFFFEFTSDVEEDAKSGLYITPDATIVKVGGDTKLSPLYFTNGVHTQVNNASWFVSDTEKASINNGVLYAKEKGVVSVVCVKDGEISNKVWVTIMSSDVNYKTFFKVKLREGEGILMPMYDKGFPFFRVETNEGVKEFEMINNVNSGHPQLRISTGQGVRTVRGYK